MGLINSIVGGLNKIADTADKNSPAILAFIGITGMISTVVIACKETPKAVEILENAKADKEYEEMLLDAEEITEEVAKADNKKLYLDTSIELAKTYAPAIITGTLSIFCLIKSYSINNSRVAALATAYSISENALTEYKAKVIEQFGKNKERKVRESIAQDKLNDHPVENCVVYETGRGNTLIFEPLTGRYYHANIADLAKAESTLNKRIFGEMSVIVNDLFDEMGFNDNAPRALLADLVGWDTEHMCDTSFTSGIATNGEPCLVIDYRTEPGYYI